MSRRMSGRMSGRTSSGPSRRTSAPSGRMVRWVAVSLTAILAGALFASCESGPSGPGAWQGSVESVARAFGAAVIEVQGAGIQGFEGEGTTLVFWTATAAPDNYRVVLVSPEGSQTVRFRTRVLDLAAGPPAGTTVEAVTLLNGPVPTVGDFSVRFVH